MAQGNDKLILDRVLEHEAAHPERIFLTQPVGGDRVVDYTWGQVLDQSRRMAAHLQSRGLPRGARIAILSKNCAHFFMAELAVWLGGYTTVAIFPTETADTVRFVLEHSEASLLFVGKLDTWPQQRAGVPAGLPCIAFPLAPKTELEDWDTITARTAPLTGNPGRTADELAMLIYTSGSTGQPKGVMSTFGALTRAAEGVVADTRARVGQRPHVDERNVGVAVALHHADEHSVDEVSDLDVRDVREVLAPAHRPVAAYFLFLELESGCELRHRLGAKQVARVVIELGGVHPHALNPAESPEGLEGATCVGLVRSRHEREVCFPQQREACDPAQRPRLERALFVLFDQLRAPFSDETAHASVMASGPATVQNDTDPRSKRSRIGPKSVQNRSKRTTDAPFG